MSYRRIRRGLLCSLWAYGLVGMLFGCARPSMEVDLFDSGPAPNPRDYKKILNRWTRNAKLYDQLKSVLFVDATYHSATFRQAFAAGFPDVYGQGGQVTRRELVDLPGDIERFHTFLVSAYTPDLSWNDLEEDDSIWRLTLTDGRLNVPPAEIIKVKIDQNLREVYPHIGIFDEAYLVRFPLTDSLGQMVIDESSAYFEMRVASSMGHATLVWKLRPPRLVQDSQEVESTPQLSASH